MRITVEAHLPRRPTRGRRTLLALLLVLALPTAVLASDIFNDVPDSNTFHDNISALAEAGITVGCGGGNFCPGANITRGQEAAFIHRAASRVGLSYTAGAIGVGGAENSKDIASVTILVPGNSSLGVGAKQFVKVDGMATIYGNGATSGCVCNMVMNIVDSDTGNVVASQFDEVAAVAGAQMSLSTSFVFAESPGSHTYKLRLNITATADLSVGWRTLIATTHTFGPMGTNDLSPIIIIPIKTTTPNADAAAQ